MVYQYGELLVNKIKHISDYSSDETADKSIVHENDPVIFRGFNWLQDLNNNKMTNLLVKHQQYQVLSIFG